MAETIHLTVQSQPPVSLSTEQARVIRAVSPTATVERIEGGAEVTITDYEQTTKAVIYDGQKGDPGEPGRPGSPGQPGVSPTASVMQTETGATVTVTDESGTTTANLTNGQDGISPTITVTDIPGGHRVTITDADGPHSFDVMDGDSADAPVQDVQVNGVSVVGDGVANVPIATGSRLGVVQGNPTGGTQVLADGRICTAPASEAEIKAGSSSYKPTAQNRNHIAAFYSLAKAAGADMKSIASTTVGVYPEVQKSAISEMLNGSVSVEGATPVINALPGVRYVCGEVATLDITLPASGCIDVVFESGSTATVLTITPPTGVTLKWANGFDPSSLEADTVYEINIADGCLGVAGTWS